MSAMEKDAFEEQVTQALGRVDAPVGFAERLMERASVEAHISESRYGAPAFMVGRKSAKVLAFPKRRGVWMSGALAAAVLVCAFAGVDVHRQHEHQRATQEFETATRITDQAMRHTREQLARAGVRLEE